MKPHAFQSSSGGLSVHSRGLLLPQCVAHTHASRQRGDGGIESGGGRLSHEMRISWRDGGDCQHNMTRVRTAIPQRRNTIRPTVLCPLSRPACSV